MFAAGGSSQRKTGRQTQPPMTTLTAHEQRAHGFNTNATNWLFNKPRTSRPPVPTERRPVPSPPRSTPSAASLTEGRAVGLSRGDVEALQPWATVALTVSSRPGPRTDVLSETGAGSRRCSIGRAFDEAETADLPMLPFVSIDTRAPVSDVCKSVMHAQRNASSRSFRVP